MDSSNDNERRVKKGYVQTEVAQEETVPTWCVVSTDGLFAMLVPLITE